MRTLIVDELHLQVFPLILGSGIRVYPETEQPVRFELASSRTLSSGVVVQELRAAR